MIKKWNKNEVEFLINNLDILSTIDIAMHLKRSLSSITNKKNQMKLKKKRIVSEQGKEKLFNKVNIVGMEFESNKSGKLKVIEKIKNNKKGYIYKIIFYNGYITTATASNIKKGNVKNPYHPVVFGVGCYGNVEPKHFLYRKWNDMLRRCYSKKSKDYKWYGRRGVTVCNEWLCFENYINDVKLIEGYDEELIINNKIHLDKDILGGNIYSKDTCLWISKEENLKEMLQRNKFKKFKAIRLIDEYEEEGYNQTEFAKKYKLRPSGINTVLNKHINTHKGWKFEYI